MDSRFELKFTQYFLKQWDSYDEKARRLIQDKLSLIKQSPFRFPKHEGYRFVFKVKLSIGNKYSRLMYAVFMPDTKHITILGIFDREADYRDFERIFGDYRG
jgi:mRNA-degrading endonuclease RelE of RelBE toxin-antitoxin system